MKPQWVARSRADLKLSEPGLIHFNSCGASLMPEQVFRAQVDHLKLECAYGGYEAHALAEQNGQGLEYTRSAIARMLNCKSREIALVENATAGWANAFGGVLSTLQEGDRILCCELEYASNLISFLQAAKQKKLRVEVIPSDAAGQTDVDRLRQMMDSSVKLISLTHVATGNGCVNPARQVGELAREFKVPFFLDACQSCGQIDLDVQDLQCDVLTATGRKFLRGPRGTGFLYARDEFAKKMAFPAVVDMRAATVFPTSTNKLITLNSGFEVVLMEGARRFENWENNVAGLVGLGKAVEYAMEIGLPRIEQRVEMLGCCLREALQELDHVVVRDLGAKKCGIVSFSVDSSKKTVHEELVQRLRERYKINTSVSFAMGAILDMHSRNLPSAVRCGMHYFNTEEEVQVFVANLEESIRAVR